MDLENALEKAGELREALASEVDRARGERQLLRSLDATALFARAAERGAFVADLARLERDLASALAGSAAQLGLAEVTLEGLRDRAPEAGQALSAILSDVRSLAAALHEIDALNMKLAGRALSVVRGYTEALQPTATAYDRRGARASTPALAMVSSKG